MWVTPLSTPHETASGPGGQKPVDQKGLLAGRLVASRLNGTHIHSPEAGFILLDHIVQQHGESLGRERTQNDPRQIGKENHVRERGDQPGLLIEPDPNRKGKKRCTEQRNDLVEQTAAHADEIVFSGLAQFGNARRESDLRRSDSGDVAM